MIRVSSARGLMAVVAVFAASALAVTSASAAAGTAVSLAPAARVAGSAGVAGRAGAWGNAEEVPGTATLNAGGNADVLSVSCGAPGNCAAGGFYADSSHRQQAFVVSQA